MAFESGQAVYVPPAHIAESAEKVMTFGQLQAKLSENSGRGTIQGFRMDSDIFPEKVIIFAHEDTVGVSDQPVSDSSSYIEIERPRQVLVEDLKGKKRRDTLMPMTIFTRPTEPIRVKEFQYDPMYGSVEGIPNEPLESSDQTRNVAAKSGTGQTIFLPNGASVAIWYRTPADQREEEIDGYIAPREIGRRDRETAIHLVVAPRGRRDVAKAPAEDGLPKAA